MSTARDEGNAPPRGRFTRTRACPICSGYADAGCNGFPAGPSTWCSNAALAGNLKPAGVGGDGLPAYEHRLADPCPCGADHERRRTPRATVVTLPVRTAPRPTAPHRNGSGPPPSDDDGDDGPRLIEFTDTRNALRLVARHGERLRRNHTRGMWMIWDGRRWGLDETEEVILYAKQVVKALPAEYADTALHPQTKKRLERAWLDCESTGRLKSMVTNAASELPATHETFDPDPWLLNCENGTIDLRSGELLPHRPDRWQSKLCPVEYRPDAECPLWDEFLDTVLAHDDSLRLFLQRAVGLSLVGQVLEHVLFVLWGGGRNGKGVFLNTLLAILGDYAKPAATDLLTSTANPQHPTSVAELRGVRFVTNAEPQQKFNENLVKFLTGGDPRNARFLFQDAFTYIPSDTFWIHTNHKPVPQGGSEGFYRRVRLIPFTVTIPPGREDPRLTEKLRAEASGILAWAVHGCLAWQRDGLGTAAAVTAATDTYRLEMDTLAAFLSDCCVLDPDASVLVGDLHQAYTEWAKQAGEPAVSQRFLGLRLGERGFERVRNGKSRAWSWKGIGLVGANVQGSLD